jgi:hypothetical protein
VNSCYIFSGNSTRGHIDTLLGLLEENPKLIVNDMEEEQLDPATNELVRAG